MNLELIYYLLYSRYGNSVIASSDQNRFKFQLFSTIFQYGPTWAKELDIQKKIRETDISEFQKGNTNLINQAANPSMEPSTQTRDELPYINSQNVSKTTRSIADGYALVLSLLKEDVTESFLKRFQKLFLTVVEPESASWYITYPDDYNYEAVETSPGNTYDGVTMTKNFRNMYFTQIYSDFESFESDWNETIFSKEI